MLSQSPTFEHCHLKNMFIKFRHLHCGLEPQMRKMLCFFMSEMSLRMIDVSISDAMIRLFTEIIENAFDNGKNSLGLGIDPRYVDENISGKTVQSPILANQCRSKCIQHLVSGVQHLILASCALVPSFTENRENKRGRNGFGNKLTNIFSHRFSVYVVDSYRGAFVYSNLDQ